VRAKPEPIVVSTICSQCGLNWDLHGDNPSLLDCIRLLKAEIAKPCQHWTWSYPATVSPLGPVTNTPWITNTYDDGHVISVSTGINA
jgi:hypothetical protein